MKLHKIAYCLLSLLLLLYACKEEEGHAPINGENGIPQTILNPTVESLPGAAKISYQLPNDRNLLYVKATCQLQSGELREIKSSYYSNNLTIDGFADTKEYVVNLYSVGRNGKESDPVEVKVQPLESPIYEVYRSIEASITETFGGVRFTIQNETRSNVRIYLYMLNQENEWEVAETYYTSAMKANFSFRGLEAVTQTIRMAVKDRWDNTTEYLEKEFTPLYEAQLDKKKFSQVDLPTDTNTPNSDKSVMDKIWDYTLNGNGNDFVTKVNSGLPQWFTFDIGVMAKLSRIVIQNRSTDTRYAYNGGSIKEFELFGSVDPNPDGSFDESWIPLRNEPCISFKPSGLPSGEISDEDTQYQIKGEEFEFDMIEPVRYIRLKTNKVWGETSKNINIVEITLYGDVVE